MAGRKKENDENGSKSPVLIKHLRPRNLLSFGPEFPGIDLGPLNVLIGPNGSGKSNLIDVLTVLAACRNDFREPIRRTGGALQWIHKGRDGEQAMIQASVADNRDPLLHTLFLNHSYMGLTLAGERVESAKSENGIGGGRLYFTAEDNKHEIRLSDGGKMTTSDNYDYSQSVLSQRRDPSYLELMGLWLTYTRLTFYREWGFGRGTKLREPTPVDERSDLLREDFGNLALVLNRLQADPPTKRRIEEELGNAYDEVSGFEVLVEGTSVRLLLTEGDRTVSTNRVSDGTLRYLSLLTILLNPSNLGFICIEEPEAGLHPDLIPKIADLLKEASSRTQLIVTTHSDILIDALSDTPESVIVCEKVDGETQMRRLDTPEIKQWLEEYSLGYLWLRGDLGGNRW